MNIVEGVADDALLIHDKGGSVEFRVG
jgi:hypothetical protein